MQDGSSTPMDNPPPIKPAEMPRDQSVKMFCQRYLALNNVPDTVLLTDLQQQTIVDQLEHCGLTLKNGHLSIETVNQQNDAGAFHQRLASSPRLDLPENVPQPVTVTARGDTAQVRYNFPFSILKRAHETYFPSQLTIEGKRRDTSYVMTQIDEASLIDTYAPITINEMTVADNIRRGETHISISYGSTFKIGRIIGDELSYSEHPHITIDRNSTLIIPEGDTRLLSTKITTEEGSHIIVEREDGSQWEVGIPTCKDVTLAQALQGYRENPAPSTSKQPFTIEDHRRKYTTGAANIRVLTELVKAEPSQQKITPFSINDRQYLAFGNLGGGMFVEATRFAGSRDGKEFLVAKIAKEGLDEQTVRQFNDEYFTLSELQNAQESLGLKVNGELLTPKPVGITKLPDGRTVIAMSFAEGKSLDRIVNENTPLALGDTMVIVEQYARVLEALHSIRKTYKDFQIRNIFWNPVDRRITCVDFNSLDTIKEGDTQLVQHDIKNMGQIVLYGLASGRAYDDRFTLEEEISKLPAIEDLRQIITRSLTGGYASVGEFRDDITRFTTEHQAEIANLIPSPPSEKPVPPTMTLIATPETITLQGQIQEVNAQIYDQRTRIERTDNRQKAARSQLIMEVGIFKPPTRDINAIKISLTDKQGGVTALRETVTSKKAALDLITPKLALLETRRQEFRVLDDRHVVIRINGGSNHELFEELESRKSEISQLEQETSSAGELKEVIRNAEDQLRSAQSQLELDQKELRVLELQQEIEQLERTKASLQSGLSSSEARIGELEQEIEKKLEEARRKYAGEEETEQQTTVQETVPEVQPETSEQQQTAPPTEAAEPQQLVEAREVVAAATSTEERSLPQKAINRLETIAQAPDLEFLQEMGTVALVLHSPAGARLLQAPQYQALLSRLRQFADEFNQRQVGEHQRKGLFGKLFGPAPHTFAEEYPSLAPLLKINEEHGQENQNR